VAIGNLDISNCADSGVRVQLPKTLQNVAMLYFSIHHNRGQDGAGLSVVTGTATLKYMDMSYNNASRNGGGLYVGASACVTFAVRFDTEDSSRPLHTFTQNWAKGKGGAVYLDNPNCRIDVDGNRVLYVRDATFSNNTAQQAGGAVYVFSGNPVLQETAALFYSLRTQALDLGFVRAEFIGNTVRVNINFTQPQAWAHHKSAHAELTSVRCNVHDSTSSIQ
jgi:hypothetical protein